MDDQQIKEISIRLTLSLEGRKCIGMLMGSKEYLLLTVKRFPAAEINKADIENM